jgi:hypothetical protein
MSRGFKHNTKTKGNESNKFKFLTRKRNAMNPSTEIWQVEPMIAQALNYDGPALVEVLVSRQELSMPPTISLEQAKGFSLFMMRAILNGRGDEIVDIAKVNLLR